MYLQKPKQYGAHNDHRQYCSGITPQQLQRIDLAKINFQEIYAELTSHLSMPDCLQAIQDRITAFQRQGAAHD